MFLAVFVAHLLAASLMPLRAAPLADVPPQLQAICHAGTGLATAPQGQPDLPEPLLPCCVLLCCGAGFLGFFAPSGTVRPHFDADERFARGRWFVRQPRWRNHSALPPQSRAPPVLI